ncbi:MULTISPECIES: winged helix-turn-helix domain-containing protein [Glutamicibacter]|uniref:DNA-binding response OmpR family regulator n=2 Tax=Glutamicibacter TaxID=1742989 RepID=A0ABX4MYK7_9MICC|nr:MULTISPECIES: response regulator transcription factor [Glutamicibacter]KWR70772.1 transcriptional regulator [Arthrobacter sp. W1]MDV2976665.1 response regulator transcription factor [Actinomycetes bacterium ARC8]PJJ44500.1 DNA-binding response OmpR family regulator [Glutamicibacter mysorens]UTM46600.1 response regulator transcription factor [Glutamicibacter mysorens]GEC11840.1 transcriptional regulatory protein GlnR [Glutamicibacter nicotianae]
MAHLLLLSNHAENAAEVLPALELLMHEISFFPATTESLSQLPECDALILDARTDLIPARSLAQLLHANLNLPLLLVVSEGALGILNSDWHATDFLLPSAIPAELDARIRLMLSGASAPAPAQVEPESSSGLRIDELSYTARIDNRMLDLTYKEFELLKYLAQFPGRVFTREQLLHEVWGYDYYGGTRTVDVHVRRLRAKLGTDHEQLIGTVRNVGYRFHTES